MQALSSSIAASRAAEPSSAQRRAATSGLLKAPPFSLGGYKLKENCGSLRLSAESEARSARTGGRLSASDGGGVEETAAGAGSQEGLSLFQNVSSLNGRDFIENTEVAMPDNIGSAATGSKTGLFRTPNSGGVHSATSTHDLPRPALAVRNLMEQARFAHLCTIMSKMNNHRAFYPFGSLVDFASDPMGHPILSLSPLAIHTRNLLQNPKCSLVVQTPGWSGLSNARVTIFGDILPLPEDQQDWAHKMFIAKHQQWSSQQWGTFHYFRMQNIRDIYFIGGFGTVAWVDINEYKAFQSDRISADGEQNLMELNAIFSKPLMKILSTENEIDDAALISIDNKGTDVRVRQGAKFSIQRLSFEIGHEVETLEEAKKALQDIIDRSSPRS